MEVKIKQGNEMINATIEMIDGVMVVSPKEEKFEPKEGDVFCVDSFYPMVGIVKEVYSYGKPDKDRLYFSVGYWKQSGNMKLGTFCACNRNTEPNYRPATEEEKQKLFDKLKEEGYEWKADTKELVKLKWKPKYKEPYFAPFFSNVDFLFSTCSHIYTEHFTDELTFKKTSVFKTEQECQEFCDRLNDVINSIKP